MNPSQSTTVRYALIGAAGDYGRTVLAQTLRHPRVRPSVLCDLDPEAVHALLATLAGRAPDAGDHSDIRVVTSIEGLEDHYDVLVEATGNVRAGIDAARTAIEAGRHVVMASKETDSIAGPYLADLAARHGVTYALAAGDQPANLVALVDYAKALGMDIIAAGKSSEYDLVVDAGDQSLNYLGQHVDTPGLPMSLQSGDQMHRVLEARARAVSGLKLRAAADACEMAVVANATGLTPDHPSLHYPVARTTELADIYSDGNGVLTTGGTLDVFTMLRRQDEASFGGGVFVVASIHDPVTAQILARKGHVVSEDRTRVCLFHPYHLMGLETVATIAHAGQRESVQPRAHVTLVARAQAAIAPGTPLRVAGHHHELQVFAGSDGGPGDAFAIEIHSTSDDTAEMVPYYLLDGAVTARAIDAGQPVQYADVRDLDPVAREAWQRSLSLGTVRPSDRSRRA